MSGSFSDALSVSTFPLVPPDKSPTAVEQIISASWKQADKLRIDLGLIS
jgi:hypothetical protein